MVPKYRSPFSGTIERACCPAANCEQMVGGMRMI